jgi:sporulation and spore germination protein/immunoglobulin-like protein involved in spore germination
MPADRSHRNPVVLIALGVLMAFLTVACSAVGSGGTLTPRSPDAGTIAPVSPEPSAEPSAEPASPEPSGTPSASPTPPRTSEPGGATSVKIYLFMDEKLVPVRRQIEATVAVGRAALNALFEGPTDREAAASPPLTTNVPDGTILLGLDIADGLATVDLSREFESGGGSAAMSGRLAQVVYTLTQFPTVDRVAFELDGEPVTVFSGEGIVIDGPTTREDYEAFLPSVFVERPTWGATLRNPVRVSGIANVFEAVFFVEVRDEDGHTLAKQRVMATCGTGCWGTFDVSIPYDVSSRSAGTITTYNLSARDGSIEDERSYPVTLVP